MAQNNHFFYNKPKLLVFLIALLTSLFFTACQKESTVEKASKEKILLKGNKAEPTNLDPGYATSDVDSNILNAIFEPLIKVDMKTLEPRPGVAKSWKTSDDGMTYTFFLREDAKWSNGDPVTAHDFYFSAKRVLSPETGSPYSDIMYIIKNAKDFHQEKIQDFNQVGIKIIDDHTLEYTLEHPAPYFLGLLRFMTWLPVHESTLKKFNAENAPNGVWTHPENIVSNGPFVMTQWVPNSIVSVKKNPFYWDANNVKLNGINFYPTIDLPAEERSFLNGQLHATRQLSDQKVTKYLQEKSPYLHITPTYSTYFYLLNTKKPPLDNVKVRQALSLAINRQEIIDQVIQDGRDPAYNFVPTTPGYSCNSKLEENIPLAQKLLAEAGYPNGQGFPEIELSYNTDINHRAIAQAVQEMWKKNLNVHVTLINKEWKVYLDDISKNNYDIARMIWIGDYIDPSSFLNVLDPNDEKLPTHWVNEEFLDLLNKGINEPNPEKRSAYYCQAETISLAEMPIIPLTFFVRSYLRRPEVIGWEDNILEYVDYTKLDIQTPNQK